MGGSEKDVKRQELHDTRTAAERMKTTLKRWRCSRKIGRFGNHRRGIISQKGTAADPTGNKVLWGGGRGSIWQHDEFTQKN